MKDEDDIMVKDLIEKFKINEILAIAIMYQIRTNVDKYFEILQKET